MKILFKYATVALLLAGASACSQPSKRASIIDENIAVAEKQIGMLADSSETGGVIRIPSTWKNGRIDYVPVDDWVSGFFAGTLWYMYELTGDEVWAARARKHTEILDSVQYLQWHHDVGFMVYDSYGNGLRLKNIPGYEDVIVQTAKSLATRFRPVPGVIQSWDADRGWQGERGFITREIIEKYATPNSTFLFCGPLAMFRFVRKALEDMGVPQRRFRHDVVNNPADISTLPGYPKGTEEKTFRITVVRGIHEDVIDARASESVAVALERSAIPVDTHCRNGECGFCRSQLLGGDIFVSPIGDGRRAMDKELGWFHACSAYPLSDLKIKIPIM